MVPVFPLYYFPPISWFTALINFSDISLEVKQHYRKQTYSTRMFIKGANGVQKLTIPVRRRGLKMPLDQKRISYQEKWPLNHWRSIYYAYRNSPYFEYYADELLAFYEGNETSLLEFHLNGLNLIKRWASIETSFTLTEVYQENMEGIPDFRKAFHANRNELSAWFNPKSYTQVFDGFDEDLSILDLIFNVGPETKGYLKQFLKGNVNDFNGY